MLQNSNDFVVKRVKTALLFNDKYKQGYSYIMATPSQAQLALERDAVLAEIAEKTALYNSMIAKGQVNSARELLVTINADRQVANQLQTDIKNYTQFSAERASQDAEIAQTQNFETRNAPANQTITSSTTSTVTSTTGGTQTTTTAGALSVSPDAENAAKQANLRASAFTANPSGKFGNNTIDRAVNSGAITQEEAAKLKAGTIPEADRFATASEARANASATVAAGTTQGPTTVTTTPTPNTTENTTVTQQVVATPPTINSNSNPSSNSTIVTNTDGTKSEVTVNNTTATITTTPIVDDPLVQGTETTIVASQNIENTSPELIDPTQDPNANFVTGEEEVTGFEPLQEPPATSDGDEFTGIDEQVERQRQLEDGSLEFAGIDEQIADNENALQEPPQLSDEEVDAYLQTAGQQDETIAEQKVPDEFDGIDAQVAANKEQADAEAAKAAGMSQGILISLRDTQGKATSQDVANFQAKPDWRVRLSLAPGAKYLYKDKAAAGILAPLAATDGVIFPYTPAISVQYAASYDPTELTHSNYKFFTYRGSAVDSVSITCDFTAQDTFEANYLLAVIHFFRSVTKMFYGQDQNPKIGTPPPLCYLSGLGAFQFDAHPLAITSFNYTLPTDVDYIRAGATPTQAGVTRPNPKDNSDFNSSMPRMGGLQPGGGTAPAQFNTPPGSRDVTYVPTKMSISIQAVPIVTRNDISNKFSLKEYGTGKLLRGTQRQGGGIW
jgi:hypothetical protein